MLFASAANTSNNALFVWKGETINTHKFNLINTEYQLKKFEGLCERAKSFAFDWILSEDNCNLCDIACNCDIFNNKLSPIEQIFNVCYFRFVCSEVSQDATIDNIPLNIVMMYEMMPQVEIQYRERIYIADFVIDFSVKDSIENYIYPHAKGLRYVIELDGYDYHSSKSQMNKDYKREQNLQELGYKVIRFTGAQIYNHPYDCIEKLVSIIISDLKGRI